MPKNSRADESILNPATSKGGSLRTTIPAFIVQQFGLKQGTVLRWKIADKKLEIEVQEAGQS